MRVSNWSVRDIRQALMDFWWLEPEERGRGIEWSHVQDDAVLLNVQLAVY